jgi:hypothetical protein
MKTRLLLASLIFCGLVSCKDKEPEATAEEAVNTPQKTEAATEGVKVNPAHGLPGHRCDLPVGAPLNSATANQTPVSELPSTSVSPIRVDQKPDVNPPHGEPYHDCSIPVGAKFNKG